MRPEFDDIAGGVGLVILWLTLMIAVPAACSPDADYRGGAPMERSEVDRVSE